MLRLAHLTGAQIVQAPPWPGASSTEEQPEPGAGIRIALALERAARAGVRVHIARAREAGMSWHEVGGALGVAGLARARGSSVAGAAQEYAAGRRRASAVSPASSGGPVLTAARWSETGAQAAESRPGTSRATPKAATDWLAQGN